MSEDEKRRTITQVELGRWVFLMLHGTGEEASAAIEALSSAPHDQPITLAGQSCNAAARAVYLARCETTGIVPEACTRVREYS